MRCKTQQEAINIIVLVLETEEGGDAGENPSTAGSISGEFNVQDEVSGVARSG